MKGKLRVWWIPQVPGDPFRVEVLSIREARLTLKTLGEYDAFQFEQNVKPDYCNVGGLETLEDEEWVEWACAFPGCGENVDYCECEG